MKTLAWTLALAVASAALPACLLDSAEGVVVELSIRGAPANGEIALDDAWIHLAGASLVPCDGSRARRVALRSVAHAHHGSGMGTLGAHVVQVVTGGAGASVLLGSARPAPGRYCALRVEVTPAGPAADGFVASMEGLALWASGRRAGEPLAVRAYGNRSIDLPLIGPRGPVELTLDAESRASTVEIEVDLPRALGVVPPAGQTPEELGLDLLVELDQGLTARVADGP